MLKEISEYEFYREYEDDFYNQGVSGVLAILGDDSSSKDLKHELEIIGNDIHDILVICNPDESFCDDYGVLESELPAVVIFDSTGHCQVMTRSSHAIIEMIDVIMEMEDNL